MVAKHRRDDVSAHEATPFPVPDTAYAVGRVSVLEKSLLDKNTWLSLLQAPLDEAAAQLEAHGYAAAQQDVMQAIDQVQRDTVETLLSITRQRALLELFLLQTDAHNLNVLYKCAVTGRDATPLLLQGGAFDPELLAACVRCGDFASLGPGFACHLDGVDKDTPPRLISAAIDRAIFAHIHDTVRDCGVPTLREYFEQRADAVNALARSRAAALGWEAQKCEQMLVEAPGKSVWQVPEDFNTFERELNRRTYALLAQGRYDGDGIVRIACYLVAKTAECRNLRLVFAAKAAGLPLTADEILPEGVA